MITNGNSITNRDQLAGAQGPPVIVLVLVLAVIVLLVSKQTSRDKRDLH